MALHATKDSHSQTIIKSSILAASIVIAATNPLLSPTSHAYDTSDYATETVQQVVKSLKESSGNVEETFKLYESIADIITEGKGVGGMINYRK